MSVTGEESEPPEGPQEDLQGPVEPETPPRAPSPAFSSHKVLDEEEDSEDGADFIVPPRTLSPEPEAADTGPRSRRATVEEVLDEDDPQNFKRFVDAFPGGEPFPGSKAFEGISAKTRGQGETVFERMRAEQTAAGLSPHAPFLDSDEWELASWLSKNVSQTATDAYLKLPIVSCIPTYPHSIVCAHLLHRPNAALRCHITITMRT